jgi:hypothetical protein
MSDYYLQYLEDIDAGGYEVTDYEAQFLEDMLKHRPQQMSVKQQALVRRMAETYLGEVVE